MGVFEFVVVIVAISVGGSVLQTWMKNRTKERGLELKAANDDQLRALEERVQVLEELVTDGKQRLRQEFDRLG